MLAYRTKRQKDGGVACPHNKCSAHENVKRFNKEICGLVITLSDGRLVFIAYLPYDNYHAVYNVEKHCQDAVNEIEMAIESVNTDNVILRGDLNIDPHRDNAYIKYIEDMYERQVKDG